MASIQSFRDLEVYQFARREAHRIFVLSRKFPREERYSLTDQIRRCSRAVCSMIAEAWGRRRYEAAFTNKLNEAVAEAMETQSWLDSALDCTYISGEEHAEADQAWQWIGGKLNKMIERAGAFCQSSAH